MARFITIGYGNCEGYERTDVAVRDAAHEHDARLRVGGAVMGIAGAPVQAVAARAADHGRHGATVEFAGAGQIATHEG